MKCGVPEKNIYLMEDGDQIEVNPNYIRKVRSVKTGKVFIDNQADRQIDYNTILDRQNLASDGILTLSAKVNRKNMDFDGEVRIASFGLTNPRDEKALSKEVIDTLTLMLKAFKKDFNAKNIEIEARNILKKLLFKRYKKYPLLSLSFVVA